MHLDAGKRGSGPAVTAVNGSRPLLAVKDTLSGKELLVDTGAEVSILPASPTERALQAQPRHHLRAANGSPICTYGTQEARIRIQGQVFTHRFYIADVQRPILGADFLLKHSLLVDLPGMRLLKSDMLTAYKGSLKKADETTLGACQLESDKYKALLQEFPKLTQADFSKHEPLHGVKHYIVTEGQPVWSKPRRLNTEKLRAAKKEFGNLLRLGIIQPSSSEWASPLHMTLKANGEWRPCGDYRKLNAITKPDRYPVPHMQDSISQLRGTTIYSKIDLVRGYHQIPVAEEDRPKTAVTTPFGSFEFLRMPFGLRNAGQTFQRTMHAVLRGLENVFVYVDDILIASGNEEEHQEDLRRTLARLQQHGLLIRPEKCEWGKTTLTFLGHLITADGIRPLPARIEAIQKYKQPENAKQLQKFLGVINYYHRFLPDASTILHRLHALAQTKPAKKTLVWSEDDVTTFERAKKMLCDATLLSFPAADAQLGLCTDASETGIGAALEQLIGNRWEPLGFYSKALNETQRKYSTFDRELLAAHEAALHFSHMIDARPCILFTDHKPLIHAWKRPGDPRSGRQQRHLAVLAEVFIDVQHKRGQENAVADALSRVNNVYQNISPRKIQAEQEEDDYIKDARTAITNLKLKDLLIDGCRILCDTSLGHPRPLVPANLRNEIFNTLHGLSHPGFQATRKLISKHYVWHQMRKDIKKWCQGCQQCQKSKINRHTKAPVISMPVPEKPFSHIHVDIVGPLPSCENYSYLLTIVDRYSRWPDAIPMKSITAKECSRALINQWVARHGIPRDITSDRGRQFISEVWQTMAESLGVQMHHTTAYHPQGNGMVERWHRTLKTALRTRLKGPHWINELPWVMLGLRTTCKEDMNISPAEAIYKHQLNLPASVVDHDSICKDPSSSSPVRHHSSPSTFIPTGLRSARSVWMRNDATHRPLDPPYTGPYPVLKKCEKYFVIKVFGQERSVSIDRLKPAFTDDAATSDIHQRTRSGRRVRPPDRFEGGEPCGSRLDRTSV